MLTSKETSKKSLVEGLVSLSISDAWLGNKAATARHEAYKTYNKMIKKELLKEVNCHLSWSPGDAYRFVK
jgi:hypothetical protein